MRTHLGIHAFVTIVLLVGELVLPTAGMLILVAVAGVLVLIIVDKLWRVTIRRERRLMVDVTLKAITEYVKAEKSHQHVYLARGDQPYPCLLGQYYSSQARYSFDVVSMQDR